jgi:hypothetical protein
MTPLVLLAVIQSSIALTSPMNSPGPVPNARSTSQVINTVSPTETLLTSGPREDRRRKDDRLAEDPIPEIPDLLVAAPVVVPEDVEESLLVRRDDQGFVVCTEVGFDPGVDVFDGILPLDLRPVVGAPTNFPAFWLNGLGVTAGCPSSHDAECEHADRRHQECQLSLDPLHASSPPPSCPSGCGRSPRPAGRTASPPYR